MTIFNLIVRQQPSKARLCSFKEKVDRRPIDPPPIIQLKSNQTNDEYLQNPYFFLYATLTDVRGETDLDIANGNRTTAGTVVQSLHRLKDIDNTDGGFFIFSDISVRLEGFYRLKFTLYEIEGSFVNRMCSIVSDIFQVYSPKSFPGMSESTFLTRSFSDQGVRIRIRKEPRSSSSNTSISGKRRRRTDDMIESDNEDQNNYMELSPMPRSQSKPPQQIPYQPPFFGRSPSPLPEAQQDHTRFECNKSFELARPTLPSPKEIFRSSPMSMQNILSNDEQTANYSPPPIVNPLTAQVLFPPTPADDKQNKLRLFSTRTLPLPTLLNTTTIPTTTNITTNASVTSWLHQQRGQLSLPPPPPPPSTITTTTTTATYTSSTSSLRRL